MAHRLPGQLCPVRALAGQRVPGASVAEDDDRDGYVPSRQALCALPPRPVDRGGARGVADPAGLHPLAPQDRRAVPHAAPGAAGAAEHPRSVRQGAVGTEPRNGVPLGHRKHGKRRAGQAGEVEGSRPCQAKDGNAGKTRGASTGKADGCRSRQAQGSAAGKIEGGGKRRRHRQRRPARSPRQKPRPGRRPLPRRNRLPRQRLRKSPLPRPRPHQKPGSATKRNSATAPKARPKAG